MAEFSPEGSLPYGWQVKVSKRHPNKVYYFNITTGDSTWECPQLDFPKVSKEKQEQVSKDIRPNTVEQKGDRKFVEKDRKHVKENKDYESPDKPLLMKAVLDKNSPHSPENLNKGPNSFKFAKDCSSSSNESSSKHYIPPTAVVAPVIHKSDEKNIVSESQSSLEISVVTKTSPKTNTKRKTEQKKLKRRNHELDDSSNVPVNSSRGGNHNSKKRKQISDGQGSSVVKATSDAVESANTVSLLEQTKDVEDIEMEDVSMDHIADLTMKNDTVFDSFAKYYIVVDTNILISKLSLLDELKDTPVNGCGPPYIVIPWVVIQELDKLKSKTSSKGTMRAAIEAIRFLNRVLRDHPRFCGQSPAHAEQIAKSYSKVNDDKILECCMALIDQISREKVILLTNDKNLVNKALICNINVHDWASMMEKIKPDVSFKGFSRNGEGKDSPDKECDKMNAEKDNSKVAQDAQKERILQSKRDVRKREIHTLMSSARQMLKSVLTEFLKEEMNEAYGEIWVKFPIEIKLLKGILESIVKKYWKMVFSDSFNEKNKRNLELLYEKSSRPEGFLGDKEECLIILSAIEDIFQQVKRKFPNSNIPIVEIQEIRVLCVNTFHEYTEIESAIHQAEYKDVLAVFEENWGIIHRLCALILDFYKVPHDFQYNKPEQMPSDIEFRQLLVNLYPGVQQIKNSMAIMIDVVRNSKPSKQAFKKLANFLLQLIPSLNLSCEPARHPYFSQKALERFCTHPSNREMIEAGLKQIEQYNNKLDQVFCAMTDVSFNKGSTSPETMILDE